MRTSVYISFMAGIFYIILGLYLGITQLSGYIAITDIFAWTILSLGILEVISAFYLRKLLLGYGWLASEGVFDLLAGCYLVFFPLLTIVVLPLLAGLWITLRGLVFRRAALIKGNGTKRFTILPLILGPLIIISSVIAVAFPGDLSKTIVYLATGSLVMTGLLRIFLLSL